MYKAASRYPAVMTRAPAFRRCTFYVERYQGFIFDEEHELSRKQIQRHCISLRAHFVDPC